MSDSSILISRFKTEISSQILVAISGAILTILLARLLDPTEYGLLFLTISVLTVLEVFAKLGIGKSAARYISEYKEKSPSQIPHIIQTSFYVNLSTILFIVLILFLFHNQIANLLDEPSLSDLLLLGILYLLFGTLAKYSRYILQGFEEIEVAAVIHTLDRITRLLFVIGFVILGYGAIGALAGYILSFIIASAAGLIFIYYNLYGQYNKETIENGLRQRIIEYTLPLTATSTANILDKQIDTILVGFFLSPVAVGYYTISKQVIEFIEKPVKALGFTLSPTYGSQKAAGDLDHATQIYQTALLNSLLIYTPAAAGIILVSDPLIPLVFGQEYSGAVLVLQILGIYAVLQSITKITSNGLDFLGRARERAVAKGITSVLNVILNIVFIPTIGVVGAAISTVVTYSLYTGTNLYIINKEFKLDITQIIRRSILIIIVTGIMSIIVLIISLIMDGWLGLISSVGTGIVVWGIVSLYLGLVDIDTIKSGLYS